jgi:hypothetical protein
LTVQVHNTPVVSPIPRCAKLGLTVALGARYLQSQKSLFGGRKAPISRGRCPGVDQVCGPLSPQESRFRNGRCPMVRSARVSPSGRVPVASAADDRVVARRRRAPLPDSASGFFSTRRSSAYARCSGGRRSYPGALAPGRLTGAAAGRLRDLPRTDARRANAHAAGGPIDQHPDALDVRVPTPLRAAVRVAQAHAERRALAAHLAHRSHDAIAPW